MKCLGSNEFNPSQRICEGCPMFKKCREIIKKNKLNDKRIEV